jgi:hypothetical protein
LPKGQIFFKKNTWPKWLPLIGNKTGRSIPQYLIKPDKAKVCGMCFWPWTLVIPSFIYF